MKYRVDLITSTLDHHRCSAVKLVVNLCTFHIINKIKTPTRLLLFSIFAVVIMLFVGATTTFTRFAHVAMMMMIFIHFSSPLRMSSVGAFIGFTFFSFLSFFKKITFCMVVEYLIFDGSLNFEKKEPAKATEAASQRRNGHHFCFFTPIKRRLLSLLKARSSLKYFFFIRNGLVS